tara:strand:+ start:760 stop:2301 length:1542 start_codon:yes stop_codon:yes gene_type:complete
MRLGLYRITFPALVVALFGTAVATQETSDKPLSVIDWLGTQAPTARPRPAAPNEPAIAKTALAPVIEVKPLGVGAPRQIGLVPTGVTGLPDTIWVGSNPDRLTTLIRKLPDLNLPAAQSLLYTVLLAEARAPALDSAAGDALALVRVEALMERGALDPALSLIEQAGVTTSAAHFDLWMQISLLTGQEDRACAVLTSAPHLTHDYDTRIFCAVRARQWENAALTLGSAQALGLLPEWKLDLLDRFLNPDVFEGADPLPAPRRMDPLSFRLFETIGEPMPTGNLPRAYAVADLRDLAGWKSQLEAAERLTRAGALPDNRLLGLYTDRRPAASGGIWDRVKALQQFEVALNTGSPEAIAKTLPVVWRAMQDADLEMAFVGLFADPLAAIALEGTAATIAQNIAFLSSDYEAAARRADTDTLISGIARGQMPAKRPGTAQGAAIHDAFNGATPRADLVASVQQQRLGETILHLIELLHRGALGDANALRDALATLRAIGLEDTARRAALQILLLRT